MSYDNATLAEQSLVETTETPAAGARYSLERALGPAILGVSLLGAFTVVPFLGSD
jgi:hypothetical protein